MKTNKELINWEKEFDQIGFGNQARIVGVKRVELKDFIIEALDRAREEGWQIGHKQTKEDYQDFLIKIIKNNTDRLDQVDYDGIAKDIIKIAKGG